MRSISGIDLNNSPACHSPIHRSNQRQWYSWRNWAS